jgi:hypothetical protein
MNSGEGRQAALMLQAGESFEIGKRMGDVPYVVESGQFVLGFRV